MSDQKLFGGELYNALHRFYQEIRGALDIEVEVARLQRAENSSNPLALRGCKYYSQNDEDGLVNAICERMALMRGRAIEFGVGNGLENNSIMLLMRGWDVAWVGGEGLALDVSSNFTNFLFQQAWVTKDNCYELYLNAVDKFGDDFDILSIDLDGNDLYIVSELLARGVRPSIIIVEYNGKFPPPIEFTIKYDANHRWDYTDYMGASFQSFVNVLNGFEYMPICCNITGVNAFFVHRRWEHRFSDVPKDLGNIFVPASYGVVTKKGHWPSARTVASFLKPAL